MSSCNLRCRLIFLHGRSQTYRVASLLAGPVGRISYNLYFDCKHVRYVTCDLINEYTTCILQFSSIGCSFKLFQEIKIVLPHMVTMKLNDLASQWYV